MNSQKLTMLKNLMASKITESTMPTVVKMEMQVAMKSSQRMTSSTVLRARREACTRCRPSQAPPATRARNPTRTTGRGAESTPAICRTANTAEAARAGRNIQTMTYQP